MTSLDLQTFLHDGQTAALTAIPPEIADLTELTSLNFADTQVSDFSALQGLSRLQWLYLNNTQVSDLSALQGLSGLQWLHLNNTQVSDLSALQGLGGLRVLTLNNTQVSDLSPLSMHPALRSVSFSKTRVTDLSVLLTIPNLRIAAEEEKIPWGVRFTDTPAVAADFDLQELSKLDAFARGGGKVVLRLLDMLEARQKAMSEPPGQAQAATDPEDDPDTIDAALDNKPLLRAATTTFVREGDGFTAVTMPRDGSDLTASPAHDDMLEALEWATEELARLASSNKIGQDEARRLERYRQRLSKRPLNAHLLNMVARALRADLNRSIEEGGLKDGDAQIVRDFLAAHRNLIAEFYVEVLNIPKLAADAGMVEDVTPEQIAEPLRAIRDLLGDPNLPITDEVRSVFADLEREADARVRSAELEALRASDDEARTVLRRAFAEFATQAVGTIGRLYLIVRKHAVSVGKGAAYASALGGGVASMDAAWNLTGKLAPYWHQLAQFFSAIF